MHRRADPPPPDAGAEPAAGGDGGEVGGLESPALAGGTAVRFPCCDGLRAVAAGAVLVFHAATLTGRTADGTGANYLVHLDVGVAVFFVLSGFLLYRPYVVAHLTGEPGPAAGRYLLRRAVRILPAYWVALVVTALAFDQVDVGGVGSWAILAGLFQIYSVDHFFDGLVQAWSLCTEVSFYVFLPVWAALLARVGGTVARRTRAQVAGLAVLVVASLAFKVVLLALDTSLGYAWLPAWLDVFALGMGLAVASAAATVRRADGTVGWSLGASPGLTWLAAGCLFWALCQLDLPVGLAPIGTGRYLARQSLAGLVAVLLVAPAVFGAQDRGLVRRFLRSRPVVLAGLVSYGVFLWHLTWVVDAVRRAGEAGEAPRFLPVLGTAVAGTLLTATASYVAVERPLLERARRAGLTGTGRRGRRAASRPSPAPGPAPAR
ncbi:MAG TPA: acyltransferase [Acidimicrobiales bacterium]